ELSRLRQQHEWDRAGDAGTACSWRAARYHPMIVIIDYGLGNALPFANVYKRLNIEVAVAHSAAEMKPASKLILPGVGAFDHAMTRLEESGMRATLEEMVLQLRVPVLGVCVGMQMMASGSDEGRLAGLGWVPGRVRSLRNS